VETIADEEGTTVGAEKSGGGIAVFTMGVIV
jgi:hypothetical protein